jgi:hypothetical protein
MVVGMIYLKDMTENAKNGKKCFGQNDEKIIYKYQKRHEN